MQQHVATHIGVRVSAQVCIRAQQPLHKAPNARQPSLLLPQDTQHTLDLSTSMCALDEQCIVVRCDCFADSVTPERLVMHVVFSCCTFPFPGTSAPVLPPSPFVNPTGPHSQPLVLGFPGKTPGAQRALWRSRVSSPHDAIGVRFAGGATSGVRGEVGPGTHARLKGSLTQHKSGSGYCCQLQ